MPPSIGRPTNLRCNQHFGTFCEQAAMRNSVGSGCEKTAQGSIRPKVANPNKASTLVLAVVSLFTCSKPLASRPKESNRTKAMLPTPEACWASTSTTAHCNIVCQAKPRSLWTWFPCFMCLSICQNPYQPCAALVKNSNQKACSTLKCQMPRACVHRITCSSGRTPCTSRALACATC